MKRSMRLGLLICAVCIMAAVMWGCGGESGSSIDNQDVSVAGIKRISVRGGTGGITLSEGDQADFIKMVNGFTLTGSKEGKKGDQRKAYSRGYCFDVEDEQGEVHSFVFFDQTMTVDLEEDYEISQEDLKNLISYWKTHGLVDMVGESHLPEAVLICKAYIEEKLPELKLEWGQFSVGEINEPYLPGDFTVIEELAWEELNRYRMVCVGNSLEGDSVYLIVDMQAGKVVASLLGNE